MTAFDDFFNNISNKNQTPKLFDLENFESELKKIDENIKQASDLNDFLNKNFDTTEARQAWENLKSKDFKNQDSETEEKKTKNSWEENST